MDRTSFLMRRAVARHVRYARLAQRQRGVTLLETLAALLIGALVIAGIATMINSSLNDSRDQQVAEYQKQLANAVNQAINLNYATVLGLVPAGTTTTWSTAQMVTQNLIPKSYANAQNAFGQSYCLLLQQPAPGQIDALLISTGGTAIPAVDLGYIAANSGVGGGLIGTASPGNAVGAYGGWSTPLSSWTPTTCAGTPGHLANQVFMNGPGNQPADDFLYRNAVPGHAELNAMNVPIGLTMVTAGTACANFTPTSAPFAADTSNHLLTCIGGFWTPTSWREPVANVAALKTLAGQVPAETRVTLDSKLPYTWNGTTWVPVAVDDNGALNFPKVVAVGNQCGLGLDDTTPPNPAALQIGVTSNGEVLSCQSGLWASTATIVLGTMDANCQIIYPASGTPYDYPNCLPPNNANSWDSVSGTMNNYVYRNVSLTRNALVTVTSYGHMNYAQCGQSGWLGQLAQYLDIMDSSRTTSYAHTEMQTPNIADASAGVSMSLNQPLPPGNYTIVIKTNWGAFTGPGVNQQKWFSSYCPAGGGTVINTPLEMGWNVSTVY
jgi:type II secretory pathway pseudopilin PulG